MQNRDQHLLALRPQLGLSLEQSTEMERFQNETLRPVLKLQHDALLAFFIAHVRAHYGNSFEHMIPIDQQQFIAKTLRSDLVLRNQLIGMALGQFTLPELAFYTQHTDELRRRLTSLLVQRVQSVYAM